MTAASRTKVADAWLFLRSTRPSPLAPDAVIVHWAMAVAHASLRLPLSEHGAQAFRSSLLSTLQRNETP